MEPPPSAASTNRDSVADWEARIGSELAVLIRQHLAEHPCPGPSPIADRVVAWASDLEDCSQARLADLGSRRLRSA